MGSAEKMLFERSEFIFQCQNSLSRNPSEWQKKTKPTNLIKRLAGYYYKDANR